MRRKRSDFLKKAFVMGRLKAVVMVALAAVPLTSMRAIAQDLSKNSPIDLAAQREALRLVDVWLESRQVYQRIPALSGVIVQGDKIVWS